MIGKVFRRNHPVIAKGGGKGYGIVQLADVAGPGMAKDQHPRGVGERQRATRQPMFFQKLIEKPGKSSRSLSAGKVNTAAFRR